MSHQPASPPNITGGAALQQTPPPPLPVAQPAKEPPTETKPADAKPAPPAPPLKFSRKSRVEPIKVRVVSSLFGTFFFTFKPALSATIEEQRQEWLAAPIAERNESARYRKEILDQVCDLLTDDPTGDFEDWPEDAMNPGEKLRAYFDGIEDPQAQEVFFGIIEAADNGYWAIVMPRSFRA